MITLMTKTAIDVLNDIADLSFPNHPEQYPLDAKELEGLLLKLESGNIICRKSPECCPPAPASYTLTRAKSDISLLDILEATGEHLNYNNPTKEELYLQYHQVAPRLGVLNQVMRTYLSLIKLTDF